MDVYFNPSTLTGENDYEHHQTYEIDFDRRRKFYLVLTGAPDGKTDYIFTGLVRLECRFNPGAPSYMSATAIYSDSARSELEQRPNGDLVAYIIDGLDASPAEFFSVNFNDINYDLQATNRTMTLVGYRSTGFSSQTVVLTNVTSQRVLDNGEFYVRTVVDPDITIRPGNTLIYTGRQFLTGKVVYVFDKGREVMEVYNFINATFECETNEDIAFYNYAVSNSFYPSEVDEGFGMTGSIRGSHNDEEVATTGEGIGFSGVINAELNPLF
jgi:hypothetical protein